MANPKAFISYSHDSPEHRRWVAQLATDLCAHGVDVILDQWDLGLGADLQAFMLEGLRKADRVIVVCTPKYVHKAHEGEGGTGYEAMIVTAQLAKNVRTNKFIPVIRERSVDPDVPDVPLFLGTKVYADLTSDVDYSGHLEELLREIHKAPKNSKPEIGENPFTTAEGRVEPVTLPRPAADPGSVYSSGIELVRASDFGGWRRLLKDIRRPLSEDLLKWRSKYEDHGTTLELDELFRRVEEAFGRVAGLVALALAGVESRDERFRHQKGLLLDLVQVPGWHYYGSSQLFELPMALGFIYHSLHGALCADTGQLQEGIELADLRLAHPQSGELQGPLWQDCHLMGVANSLGGSASKGWKFVTERPTGWPWLVGEVFGGELDFKASLCAYYMALSVMEFCEFLSGARGGSEDLLQRGVGKLDVPPLFALESVDVTTRAKQIIWDQAEVVRAIFDRFGVSRETAVENWDHWVRSTANWLFHSSGAVRRRGMPHRDLLQNI